MIVDNGEIRNRVEQLRLSYEGYKRQLSREGVTWDRQERLSVSVRMLEEEIGTLEKLAQFGRVEADREKIEAEVRSRLSVVKERLGKDPALDGYSQEEREHTSGEVKALEWALGEDRLVRDTREWARETAFDPTRAERRVPGMLEMLIREGSDSDTRANAAYDAGQLHIVEAIPVLVKALGDQEEVAEMALRALCRFSEEELRRAELEDEVIRRVGRARQS